MIYGKKGPSVVSYCNILERFTEILQSSYTGWCLLMLQSLLLW